ncbi:hypothetical protein Tco_1093374 [Tanacetum coccineum]|uniref:Uncharacterized protein n=1 Tax=Tanacetum coccineum TaxID=301880 RepID=A0ABQ5IDP9_9ASTR
MLDSQRLITMMPPAQALKSIQDMEDHSQNWYDGVTTWQRSSYNSNDIVVITNILDSLGRDMQKLKESIHAIQVGHNKDGLDIENMTLEEYLRYESMKESRLWKM